VRGREGGREGIKTRRRKHKREKEKNEKNLMENNARLK